MGRWFELSQSATPAHRIDLLFSVRTLLMSRLAVIRHRKPQRRLACRTRDSIGSIALHGRGVSCLFSAARLRTALCRRLRDAFKGNLKFWRGCLVIGTYTQQTAKGNGIRYPRVPHRLRVESSWNKADQRQPEVGEIPVQAVTR